MFAALMVSLNSVRLPLAVPTVATAFCVNAVNDVGAPGAPAVCTRPFTWLVGMLNVPFVRADAALEKYPTSVTDAALGLISHAVVMFTADGKLFTALSVIDAMLCDAPEFTVTVNDVDFDALNDTVSMFDVRPAWPYAFDAKIASVATTGRLRSRIMQEIPGGGVTETGAGCAVLCWSAQTELIRSLHPRA